MNQKIKKNFVLAGVLFALFLLFMILVLTVDVQPIGPENTEVGFAAFNALVRDELGVRMFWYEVTEVLGLAVIVVAAGFCGLGALQLVKRKSLWKVDGDLCLLGVYFVLLVAVYVLFMFLPINHRPIVMDGELETSFPSSHTMLVIGILGAAMIRFAHRIRNRGVLAAAEILCAAVIAVTVVGRLLSGVHWVTDIIGGLLIGGALVALYAAFHEIGSGKSLGELLYGRHGK